MSRHIVKLGNCDDDRIVIGTTLNDYFMRATNAADIWLVRFQQSAR